MQQWNRIDFPPLMPSFTDTTTDSSFFLLLNKYAQHTGIRLVFLYSLFLLFVRSPTLAICAKHIMPRHIQKNRMEQTQKIPVFFCSSDSISAEYTERKHMDAVWNEAFTRSLFGIVRDFVGFVCVFCFGKRAFTKHFRLRNCWKTLNQWKNNGQTGFKHTQHTNK